MSVVILRNKAPEWLWLSVQYISKKIPDEDRNLKRRDGMRSTGTLWVQRVFCPVLRRQEQVGKKVTSKKTLPDPEHRRQRIRTQMIDRNSQSDVTEQDL